MSLFLAFLVIFLLYGCDPAYPVYIKNGFDEPVLLDIYFSSEVKNKNLQEITIQPGQRIAILHIMGDIERVAVLLNGQELYYVDKNYFYLNQKSLRIQKGTWVIEKNGIHREEK